MNNTNFDTLKQIMLASQNIVIVGHIDPDADCIGASLSLGLFLKNLGKNVDVLFSNFNDKYKMLSGFDMVISDDYQDIPDLCISVDCGSIDRLGKSKKVFESAKTTINIDHHISNNYYGEYNYIEADKSSASEIVYDLLMFLGGIDKYIAGNLYAGIISDTGGLRHPSTSIKTMQAVTELMRFGIDFTTIYNEMMHIKSVTEMQIFKIAIGDVVVLQDYPIAYTGLSLQTMVEVGAKPSDLDGISSFLMGIRGVDVALFAYQTVDGKIKMSIRSKTVNVSEVAAKFGGGGHIYAAGCSIVGNMDEVVESVIEQIKLSIDKWQGNNGV